MSTVFCKHKQIVNYVLSYYIKSDNNNDIKPFLRPLFNYRISLGGLGVGEQVKLNLFVVRQEIGSPSAHILPQIWLSDTQVNLSLLS